MSRLRPRLDRLAANVRPDVPRPPAGFSVIMDDDDAARHRAWFASLTEDERAAVRQSGAIVAVDFRLHPPA